MNNTMSDAVLNHHKAIAYIEGVKNTLLELREVYGKGIEDTDIWQETMTQEDNN